MSKKLYF